MKQTVNQLDPLLARQAILNSDKSVFGYELLFRDKDVNFSHLQSAQSVESYNATGSVVLNVFSNLNFDTFSGAHRLFINFTKQHLIELIPLLLPKEKIIVEVLEDCDVDEQLLNALGILKEKGYVIALDDFEYEPNLEPLIGYCEIIKIDIENKTREQLKKAADMAKTFGVKILAERVETHENFRYCQSLAFDYFQGYFFCKPDLILGNKIEMAKDTILSLINETNKKKLSFKAIESIILLDPKLAYRLLLLANSVLYRGANETISIRDAIIRLGVTKIKSWSLILLTQNNEKHSSELIGLTLVRARCLELLGESICPTKKDHLYMLGIFSNLDALLNEEMSELLIKINIDENIKKALITNDGELYSLYNAVRQIEMGNFERSNTIGVSQAMFSKIYRDSIKYANSFLSMI